MAVPLPRRRFTVDEYYRMAEAGIFKPDERVELLEGEIVPMNPVGTPHFWCVNRLNQRFSQVPDSRWIVSVQGPLRLHDGGEPEPDVVILRPDTPQNRHPGPADALLVIEVADGSITKDRGLKRGMYARARIPEYWIVDLNTDRVEVYRQPWARGYRSTTLAGRGETISPLCAPDLVASVDAILGEPQPDQPAADISQAPAT
jgi:Uma2 family endonuclease